MANSQNTTKNMFAATVRGKISVVNAGITNCSGLMYEADKVTKSNTAKTIFTINMVPFTKNRPNIIEVYDRALPY